MSTKTPLVRVTLQGRLSPLLVGFFVVIALVSGFAFKYPGQSDAATLSTINFQARLQTNTGALVPDGNYNVQFKLYSASSGGTALWTETYQNSASQGVTVKNGYLTTGLGSITSFPGTINWDQDLYVTMNIGGTSTGGSPTYDGEMNPRLKLTGVPYAFKAGQLAKLTGGNTSTLDFAVQTGARSILLPDESGTICIQNSVNCGFLTGATANANYIQNQNSVQQATSNFWISGTGRIDTVLQAPLIDTATAVALNLGTTNATQINLNKNVVVASGQYLSLTGGITSTRPASPTEGMLYFDTTTKQLLVYANGKWQADRAVSKTVAPSTASQALKDSADYVATGTADQTIINTALTAAAGGRVILLEGTFTTTDAISVPNNTTLAGNGRGTVIQFGSIATQNKNMITNSDTTTGEGVVIRDLRLEGNKAVNTSGTQRGIYLNNVGAGSSGAGIQQGPTIINNWVNNFRETGIYVDSSANGTVANNNVLYNVGDGINIKATNRVTVSNNTVMVNSAFGVHVSGALAIAVTGNTIAGNGLLAGTNSGGGVLFDGSSTNNAITNNTFRDNAFSTGAANSTIYISSASSNSITGNSIYDAAGTGYGINVFDSASTSNYFADNTLIGTGATGINDAGTTTVFGGQVNGSGNYLIQPAGTVELMKNTNVTGTISGTSSLTLGTSSSTNGTIVLKNSTNTNTVTVLSGAQTGNFTATIPVLSANDTFCLVGLANCGGSGANVALSNLSGVNIGTTALNSTSNNLNLTTTTSGNIVLNSAGTIELQDNTNITGNVTLSAGSSLSIAGGITSTRPGSPTEGMLYFDTTTKQLLVYANGKWQADRSSSTKIVGTSASGGTSTAVASQNYDSADYVNASTTSAQTVINSAITALPSSGGTVFLMDGTYIVDGTVNVPSNVTLVGSGNSTILKIKNATNAALVTVTGTGTEGMTIKDLVLEGNKTNNSSGIQTGFYTFAGTGNTVQGLTIDNVVAQNFRNNGIEIWQINYATITNTIAYNNGANGIITQSATSLRVTYSSMNSNAAAGLSANGNYAVIANNTAKSNGTYGIINATTGGSVTGNSTFSNTTAGISATTSANVSGNTSNTDGIGIVLGANIQSTTISSNTIISPTNYGIQVANGTANYNTISNNTITGVTSGSGSGIYVNGNYNNITNNYITDTAGTGYAITLVNSNSTGNILTGNNYSGTGASSINDVGTGTIWSNQADASGNIVNKGVPALTVGTSTVNGTLSIQGGVTAAALGTPSAPTVSRVGASGSASYSYAITALDGTGETLASSATTYASGATPLTGANYTTVTFSKISGATSYKIYRTAVSGGGSPSSLGLVGTVTATSASSFTFNDTGIAASGSTPAANTSGGATFAGAIQGNSSLTLGTSSSANGTIVLKNSTNANTVTIFSGAQTGNFTASIPVLSANDTFCMVGLANCGSTGAANTSLSNLASVNIGTTALNSTSNNLNLTTTTSGNIVLNSAGTIELQDNTNIAGSVTISAGNSLSIVGGITSTRPASPTEGMLYFDTTTKKLLVYSNGKWQADRADSVIVAASNSSQADKDAADFVADGNTGTAADGDQVQINAALTAGSGKKVVLLAGTYTVDAGISVQNNTVLSGVGDGTVITVPNSLNASIPVINNTDHSTGTGVKIRDLKLDGNKTNQSSGFTVGIEFDGMGAGTGTSARKGGEITSVTVNNFTSEGIYLITSNNNTLTGNTSQGNSSGISMDSSSNNTVTGNILQGITYGISLAGGSDNNLLSGNAIQGNSTVGISINSSNSNTVTGNNISNSGGSTNNDGMWLNFADATIISNNTITDTSATSTNYAININNSGSDNTYLSDNRFSSTPGTATIRDLGTGTRYAGQSTKENGLDLVFKQAASTSALAIQNANGVNVMNIDTTNGELEVGNYNGGTNAVAGKLVIANATNANTVIVISGAQSGNYTASIPVLSANDTFCMVGLANCGVGANTSLSNLASVNIGTTALNSTSNNLNLTTTTSGNIVLNSAGTIELQDNTNIAGNVTLSAGSSLSIAGGITSTRPASPTAGMLYFDTTTKQLLTYANGKWQADRTDAVLVAASNSSQADKDAADFVADGNTGTAADGDQVQINAALIAGAGKKVLLLAGTYTIDASVSVPNNTTLAGVGKGTVVEFAAVNVLEELIVNTDTTNGTGIVLRDMKLDGRSDLNTTNAQEAIYFSNVGKYSTNLMGATITNLDITRFRSYGIDLYHSDNTVISNNNVYAVGDYALSIYGQYNKITNNTTTNNQGGVDFAIFDDNNTVTGNTARGNTSGYGFQISADNNTVTGNISTGNISGFEVQGNDNTLTGNTATASTGRGFGVIFSNKIVVSDNVSDGNAEAGIEFYDVKQSTITGNVLANNAEHGILVGGFSTGISSDVVISNNNVYNNGGTGTFHSIFIDTYVTNAQVTDNRISDTAGTGNAIRMGATGVINTYLAGNSFSGTGATTINDAGTGTIYAGQSKTAGGLDVVFKQAASTSAATFQNANGVNVLNIDTTNGEVEIGSYNGGTNPVAGKIVIANATTAFTVTVNSAGQTGNFTATVPVLSGNDTFCMVTVANCVGSGGGGTNTTLQGAYDNDVDGSNAIMTLNSTDGSFFIRDASTALGTAFAIQNNGGTANYLAVSSAAVTLQDAAGNNALVFDSTTSELRVYENVTSPSRYARIYYDTSNNAAVFAASSGATQVGSGTGGGDINFILNGAQTDALNATKTYSLGSAYSGSDFNFTRTLTGTSFAASGNLVKIEDTSSFTGGSMSPNLLYINQNNTGATGNLIVAKTGGSVEKFKVDVSGNTTAAGTLTVAGAISSGSSITATGTITSGGTFTSAGSVTVLAGGANKVIVKPGTNSTSSFEIQNAGGGVVLSADTTNNRLYVGTSDTTGTVLVLDTKTDSGDPTGVNGAMYYNSNAGRFRCYENSAWADCLGYRHLITLSADTTSTASTACMDVAGASFPVTAGVTYHFQATIARTATAATIGASYSANGLGTPTLFAVSTVTGGASTQGGSGVHNTCTLPTNASATTTGNIDTVTGVFIPSANGTFQLRYAPETATAGQVIKAGSTLEWW